MEVYQSSKTAKELEFALGAVPSIGENNHWFIGDVDTGVSAEGLTPFIGENGNWWVGETDTGVYAGGVKVEGAEVGQIIVVKAVDENGVPTEWEAVSKGFRLITEIVTTEDVATIDIDKDMNGNPFELTEFVVFAHSQGTAAAGQFRVNVYAHNDNKYSLLALSSFKGLDTTKRYWAMLGKYTGIPGYWMRGYAEPDSSRPACTAFKMQVSAGIITGLNNEPMVKNPANETLTTLSFIRLTSNTSGNNIATGSRFVVYGR
jgi:hypothetical protein